LSQSMVRKYDEHKSDLTVLKRLVRMHFPENGQELYKLLFKDERPKSPSYYN